MMLSEFQRSSRLLVGRSVKYMQANAVTVGTLAGLILGIILGGILKAFKDVWTPRQVMYLSFLGDLFLRMLKGIIIPLIFSCLVSAISSINIIVSRKIAVRGLCYYLCSTTLAVSVGILLVLAIGPGRIAKTDEQVKKVSVRPTTTADSLLDLVRNMFPPNIIEACFRQYKTELIEPENIDNKTIPISEWDIKLTTSEHTNMLGVIFFACVFGVALSIVRLTERMESVIEFFQGTTTILLLIVNWIIYFAPVGILFLVAAKIMGTKNIMGTLVNVGFYFMTVILGLVTHILVMVPLIYWVITRKNPYRYLANMCEAAATALGTGSSAATLPYTMKCCEEKNNVDKHITRLLLPIGATINMDGTALYEAVAVIFIAQIRGISLRVDKVIAVGITAVAASVGAAAIPQAGLVTMVMVLHTIGLTAEDITLIIAVDWLVDRFRTTVNILSDAFGAGIVQALSKKDLEAMEEWEDQELKTIH